MLEIPVYSNAGEQLKAMELDENILGGKVHYRLLRDAVIMYEANKRVGTASTKLLSEIKGSSKKPWRQKGTGYARSGHKRSPLWRGGSKSFGPRPRDYSYAIPKKAKRIALQSALLWKIRDAQVLIVDKLEMDQPSTKTIVQLLKNLQINGSCLIVTADHDSNVAKSVSNMPKVEVCKSAELCAYNVARPSRIVMTAAALEVITSNQKSSSAVEEG